jgi:hypothetical protein
MKVHWYNTLLNVLYYTIFTPDPEEPKTKRNLSNCDNVSVGDDRL